MNPAAVISGIGPVSPDGEMAGFNENAEPVGWQLTACHFT